MSLRPLSCHLIGIMTKTPERGDATGDLDRRIQAEADQGNTAGKKPGRNGDHAFQGVPENRQMLEPPSALGDFDPMFHASNVSTPGGEESADFRFLDRTHDHMTDPVR